MNLTIELSDENLPALKAKATARGVSAEQYALQVLEEDLTPEWLPIALLLTKKYGKWEPVWYKAGVVTRHCRRVLLATARQILFCEETDGGMGHSFHGLYVVDFYTQSSRGGASS